MIDNRCAATAPRAGGVSRSLRRPPEAQLSMSRPGMSPAKFIPIGQVSLDVQVLRYSLTVGRIVLAPEFQRVHVEILPVEIDALLADEADQHGQ